MSTKKSEVILPDLCCNPLWLNGSLFTFNIVPDFFGCNSTVSQEQVDCLRQVDGNRLDNFYLVLALRDGYVPNFIPVVDGEFIPQVIQNLSVDSKELRKARFIYCPLFFLQ